MKATASKQRENFCREEEEATLKGFLFEIKMLTRSIECLPTHAHPHALSLTRSYSVFLSTHARTHAHTHFTGLRQTPGLSSSFDGIPVSRRRWYVAC